MKSQLLALASIVCLAMSTGCKLPGSNSDSGGSSSSSSSSGGEGGGASSSGNSGGGSSSSSGGNAEQAELAGPWGTACAAAGAAIGSNNAPYYTLSLDFSGGSVTMVTSYFSQAGCSNGDLIAWIEVDGTFTAGATVSSPAGGFLVRTTLGDSTITYDHTLDSYLNGSCGTSAFNQSSGSGGWDPESALTCNDGRFSLAAPGSNVDLVIVYNASALATTTISHNLPGVLNGVSVDTSTSVSLPWL